MRRARCKPGIVVRLPVGSHAAWEGADLGRSRGILKPRLAVVEWVLYDGHEATAKDANGWRYRFRPVEAELVTSENHTLQVQKFNRGGHPIQGWNWPLWGYRYTCNCGHECGQDGAEAARAEHAHHLEKLARKQTETPTKRSKA